LCIVLAAMFGLYKGADWLLLQRANARAAKQQKATPPPAAASNPNSPAAQPFPEHPSYQSPSQTAPITRMVTKCIVNGKTSYGDGACGQGAVATQVVTRSNHNLIDAVQIPVVVEQLEPVQQQTMVVQSSGGQNLANKKAVCQALDAEIVRLDALARQPQSAQSQDRITAERRSVRDQQHRLPCQ
jgi:hypothetical protein